MSRFIDRRTFLERGTMAAAAVPLQPQGGTVFRLGEPEYSPDTAEFLFIAGGKARVLRVQGINAWREEIA